MMGRRPTRRPADPLEAPDNPEDAFALFNECMEEHGIAGGVTVFAGGDAETGAVEIEPMEIEEVDPQTAGGSLEDFDADMYDEANKACEGHLANIDAGFDMTPEQQAAFDDAQLEFADCMAEHGIDVPEPASSGGGIVVSAATEEGDPQSGVGSPDDLDFDFEAFDEAAKDCDSAFAQLESIQP